MKKIVSITILITLIFFITFYNYYLGRKDRQDSFEATYSNQQDMIANEVAYIMGHYLRTIEIAEIFLMEHEGFRSKPYKCLGGKKTIGYGDTLIFNQYPKLTSITEPMAYHRLHSVLNELYYDLVDISAISYIYTPEQTAAIMALVYRIGITRFKASNLFSLLKHNADYHYIKKEWLEFSLVKGEKLLTNRVNAEWALFTQGKI